MIPALESKFSLFYGLFEKTENVVNKIGNFMSDITEKTKDVISDIDRNLKNITNSFSCFMLHTTSLLLKLDLLLPSILIHYVHEAYEKGDKEAIQVFLSEFLELKDYANRNDQIEALWDLIKLPPKWLKKDQFGISDMKRYLLKALVRRTRKLKLTRSKQDELQKFTDDLQVISFDIDNNSDKYIDNFYYSNPIDSLLTKEEINEIQGFVMQNLSKNKYKLEYKIVALMFIGYTPADCVKALNCTWNDITNLQKRLRKRKRKYVCLKTCS